MANTRVQLDAEDWIRREWLPRKFGQSFSQKKLTLKPGGMFIFDAISADNTIVVNISTSSGIIAGRKKPSGKFQKLRADMLFLLMTQAEKRVIILTERDMYELCMREKANGRVPEEIEFLHVELPDELSTALKQARDIASTEVSPKRKSDVTQS